MSDEPPEDRPALAAVPTASDKLLGALEGQLRLMRTMREHTLEVAKFRKSLYESYLQAGFDQGQALELVRGSFC